MGLPQAIREMPLVTGSGLEAELPGGLTIRSSVDASGRPLYVVHNASYKAFSIPQSLAKPTLPDWFLERVRTL